MNDFSKHGRSNFRHFVGNVASVLLIIFLVSTAHSRIDFNNNHVSDLWEKQYNSGNLFTTFEIGADPDGDGWTNEQEAAAGTDPFSAIQHGGFLLPTITLVPATYHDPDADGIPDILIPETAIITWPTIQGKHYTLCASPDLSPGSWIIINDELLGEGLEITECIQLTQPDGSRPGRLFWRVHIKDTDSDSDQLTDAEEFILGTSPFSVHSDEDFLSDTLEIFNYLTDPANSDTDADGIADHDELAQIALDGPDTSTYAPSTDWVSESRSLSYSFSESRATPPEVWNSGVTTSASWNLGLGSYSTRSSRYSLGGLASMLPSFPGPNQLVGFRNSGLGSAVRGFSSILDHDETVWFDQAQIRLLANTPAHSGILRRAMLIHYDGIGGVAGLDALSFSIPAGKFVSIPQIFGADFQPISSSDVRKELRGIEFSVGSTLSPSLDNTGAEVWTSTGRDEEVTGKLSFDYAVTNGVLQRLEIAPAPGSENYISLANFSGYSHGSSFKIRGLLPTPEDGAQIVPRLRGAPTVIFATMRVHVFEKRIIPVKIYHIWDSRKPNSWGGSGLSSKQIETALNDIFKKQGNVTFKFVNAEIVDLKRYPEDGWWIADQPLYFTEDGSFDSTAGAHPAWDFTHKKTPQNVKLTIHIVHAMLDPALGGFAFQPNDGLKNQTCFLPQNAVIKSYAHEVGHCLGLSTKAVGQANKHDLGLWPADWKIDGRVGLMHPQALPSVVEWTRREDWRQANLGSIPLE